MLIESRGERALISGDVVHHSVRGYVVHHPVRGYVVPDGEASGW
ncbi:hypothetical protein [Streptomyces wuyuanensis]